jgi:hypothetical protein
MFFNWKNIFQGFNLNCAHGALKQFIALILLGWDSAGKKEDSPNLDPVQ